MEGFRGRTMSSDVFRRWQAQQQVLTKCSLPPKEKYQNHKQEGAR